MNTIKKIASSSKEFVYDHKVGFAIATTATLCLVLQNRNFRTVNNFLKEKGLYEEFWTPEEY